MRLKHPLTPVALWLGATTFCSRQLLLTNSTGWGIALILVFFGGMAPAMLLALEWE